MMLLLFLPPLLRLALCISTMRDVQRGAAGATAPCPHMVCARASPPDTPLLLPNHPLPPSMSQIGQVMLATPNSLWKTGFVAGLVWLLIVAVVSLWTMYILAVMYLERKRDLVSGCV